jgi:hypothetical protein
MIGTGQVMARMARLKIRCGPATADPSCRCALSGSPPAQNARTGAGEHNAALLVGRAADGWNRSKAIEAHLRVHRIGDPDGSA